MRFFPRSIQLLTSLCLAWVLTISTQAAEIWKVRLKEASAWTAVPNWVNEEFVAENYDCKLSKDKNVLFSVQGASKSMKWQFNSQQELAVAKYLVIRYRATDIDPNSADFVLYMGGMSGTDLLSVPMKQLEVDGEWHTGAFPTEFDGHTTAIAFQVFTAAGAKEGSLEVESIALADTVPPDTEKKN